MREQQMRKMREDKRTLLKRRIKVSPIWKIVYMFKTENKLGIFFTFVSTLILSLVSL